MQHHSGKCLEKDAGSPRILIVIVAVTDLFAFWSLKKSTARYRENFYLLIFGMSMSICCEQVDHRVFSHEFLVRNLPLK